MIKARTKSSQILIEDMEPMKNNKTKMTLDEAIKHAEEVAALNRISKVLVNTPEGKIVQKSEIDCLKCAEEHEQLARWLKELKDYREGLRTCENCKYEARCGDEFSCSICRCNHPNKFEWKGGEES